MYTQHHHTYNIDCCVVLSPAACLDAWLTLGDTSTYYTYLTPSLTTTYELNLPLLL